MTEHSAAYSPAPSTLEEVLTPEWLTFALAQNFPGITVTKVDPGPVATRLGTNAGFTVDALDTSGRPATELPRSLYVKGYFGEHVQDRLFLGFHEAAFYRDVSLKTGVRMLNCVYAGTEPTTQHGVVITEDLNTLGGTFLNPRSPYTVEQVAESLEQLASLHARTLHDVSIAQMDFLQPRIDGYFEIRGPKDMEYNLERDLGAGMPASVQNPPKVMESMRNLSAFSMSEGPLPVIHGDAHIGNIFLDSAGKPGLLDWQVVQHGSWYFDVAYHIASALPTAERQQAERDLLRHYLDVFTGFDIESIPFSQAWDLYRRGVIYGLFMWFVTILESPENIGTFLQRLGTAAADLESFSAAGVS